MSRSRGPGLFLAALAWLAPAAAQSEDRPLLKDRAALGDWRADAPGTRRLISPAALPPPFATPSADNVVDDVLPPPGAAPRLPEGLSATRFATGLDGPRLLRVAPNGDVFVSEMLANKVMVLRARDGARSADTIATFASGLDRPFGIAFYPPGPNPKWLYVAQTNSVVRFAYANGDLAASGAPQPVVPRLAAARGGHLTRDVVFDRDGRRMLVSVGSFTNAAETMPPMAPEEIARWERSHAVGAAWGADADRADVLAFDPDGAHQRIFATGIRNCVALGIEPATHDVWCTTNERDELGDDLVPDYATRVRDGGFYGWPWFYIGANEDPRHARERPELAATVVVPDVLIQPHSAPLGLAFVPAAGTDALPKDYAGDALVVLHGSWNRATRTGYKVVRLRLREGVPTGEYDDVMTGFVVDDASVWGRPVGVAIARDGALLVSTDDNGIVWRVAKSPTAPTAKPIAGDPHPAKIVAHPAATVP